MVRVGIGCLGAGLLALASAGCGLTGGTSCTDKGCVSIVALRGLDGSGQTIQDLDLTDGQGRRYTGTVKPSYVVDEDFNGEGCGTCTSGEVSVTLQ